MFEPIDYEEMAVGILSNQYRKPHMESQATLIGMVFNELQETLYKITMYCFLDNATSYQLDILGGIWNTPRGVYDDKDYREAILANTTILVNGTIDEIEESVLGKYEATYAFVHNVHGASGSPSAMYSLVTDANITTQQIENISGAGIKVGNSAFLKSINNGFNLRKIEDDTQIITIG